MLYNIFRIAIVTFFLAIFCNAVLSNYGPEQLGNTLTGWAIYIVTLVCIIIIWWFPAIISLRNKEMENRGYIAFISLLLPLVGGILAYFLIRKRLNK